ncbi:GntR family transcriptional regulator [Actinoplanes sp. URMC 104]|uniref:GntR family transcriptional regulator n=1 Tax=Actinoplanes sp. URMC 104 TaxID=3423409 RepID=UPI003F19B798
MSQQPLSSGEEFPTGSAGNGRGRPRLVDHAYQEIRDDLITLRIEPGAPLDEKQLSTALGVGLTPVRDAIKRLTLERLVVIYPRRGTFAAEINISDERWLTEARTGLEGLAAALAAQRATDADRAELLELAQKLDAARLSMSYIDHDAAVHRAIYAVARNPYLESTLNQYTNAALRIWHYALRNLGSHTPRACDQAEVIDAIVTRDGERARAAAEAHLLDFSVEVRRLLRT